MKTLPIGLYRREGDKAQVFSLPIAAVTEKMAFLGATGSGKTYGATRMAEAMLDAGAQIVALDPVGVWAGLRMGVDYKIYIFGGLRGDVPLEPTGGALVADIIVSRGISAILDVSHFEHDSDRTRFATAFAERFYFLKKTAISAVHIFIEECQEFLPQNPQRGEEKMLHAFQRIWKIGRNFGIGGSLISQRPQEVNKKALNQSQTLFVFRLTGPQERKALQGWVSDNGDNGVSAADLDELLPKIKLGQPHVWSPNFLGISEVVEISRKRTADISQTPTVGERSTVKALTSIDCDKLRIDMAATIERTKSEDPAELRKEIAKLKRELEVAKDADFHVVPAPEPTVIVESRLTALDRDKFEALALSLRGVEVEFKALRDRYDEMLLADVAKDSAISRLTRKAPARTATEVEVKVARAPANQASGGSAISSKFSSSERKVMTCLAQFGTSDKAKIAAICGCSPTGGGFNNILSSLRSKGFIEPGNPVSATAMGLAALGDYQTLPTGAALVEYWAAKLSSTEGTILRILYRVYPRALSKDDIAKQMGLSAEGGGFNNCLSALRTRELITRGNPITASKNLFS